MDSKTVLITGGCGFIGSHFVRLILRERPTWRVINVDKLTYAGNLDNLKEVAKNPRYKFVKGDIAVKKDVKKAIGRGVDLIVNYAAESHVDRSVLDPEAFVRTDVLGTYCLLEAVRENRVAQYIQISTDEVFGSIRKGKFKETSPFEPNSPYSASKAGADHLCRAYFKTYGLPIVVTHSCNFYGPNQYPEKLIPLFITNLLEDKKVPIYGRGDQIREWIFTEDHCRAIETLIEKGEAGEVYNIGTGNERKNIEITKFILNELGFDQSRIEYVKDRPGHDFRYAINNSKLKKLGWSPTLSFEEGLSRTINWYQKNDRWWKKLKSGEYLKYYKRQYGKK